MHTIGNAATKLAVQGLDDRTHTRHVTTSRNLIAESKVPKLQSGVREGGGHRLVGRPGRSLSRKRQAPIVVLDVLRPSLQLVPLWSGSSLATRGGSCQAPEAGGGRSSLGTAVPVAARSDMSSTVVHESYLPRVALSRPGESR